MYLPHCYLPDLVTSRYLSNHQAAVLVSLINLGNMLGRIIMGAVVDLPWLNTVMVYSASMGFTAMFMISFLVSTNFYLLAVLSLCYGLSIGNSTTCQLP